MRPGKGPLTLVPFTADLLTAVQPWFDHPEVNRRLGGRDWPARELTLLHEVGAEHRGMSVLRALAWVVLDESDRVVAKVGGDVYDRWALWDGSDPLAALVTAVEAGPAMGLSYVVDPELWGRGIGRASLRAVVEHPQVSDVRVFAMGIDVDNVASRRCAAAADFELQDEVPDFEGTVFYLLRR